LGYTVAKECMGVIPTLIHPFISIFTMLKHIEICCPLHVQVYKCWF
jgi:hypothetical protein